MNETPTPKNDTQREIDMRRRITAWQNQAINENVRECNKWKALATQYSVEREHNAMQALAYKAERDEWKAKYIQQNKDLGCELMDPNGTIWDYAKTLQRELAEARAEAQLYRNFYCKSSEEIESTLLPWETKHNQNKL